MTTALPIETFSEVFEATPHPYLVLAPDAAFTIVAVNERYLAATGTHRDAIVGRPLFEVFPDSPDDPSNDSRSTSELRASLERVLRDRKPDVMGVQKYDIPHRDGGPPDANEAHDWRPVNTPVLDAEGAVHFLIHHLEDASEFIRSRERAAAASAAAATAADATLPQPPRDAAGDVLIADDNADMRRYLKDLLQQAGFAVRTAADGEAALAACRSAPPDLLLSDVMTPEGDSFALLRRLRADPATATLPVILLSARADADARVQGLAAGADDYLVKPFVARALVARVDATLRLARLRREHEQDLIKLTRRLAQKSARLNEAQAVAHIGSWELDLRSNVLSWSDEAYRIFGLDPKRFEATYEAFLSHVHPDDRDLVARAYVDALTRRVPYTIEHRMLRADGSVRWVHEQGRTFYDDQGRPLRAVGTVQDISERKQAEERLAHCAHHDALTDLPNRTLFAANLDKALDRARRHRRRVGLLLLDLDRFKLINDTLGHTTGDQLLQEVAHRLLRCARAEDTVARLGGDEFAIIVNDLSQPHEATPIATKIIEAVAAPVAIEGRELRTSASVGIGLFPDDADTGADLVRAADAAMYRAKARGRNTYDFYTAELSKAAAEHLAVETELRSALARNELRLYFQPQFDVASGGIAGVEALLRWQHPQHGLLLPDRFVSIAEESGQIDEIGAWVVDAALDQATRWGAEGLSPPRIAINVSGRQILYDHVAESVVDALRRHGPLPAGVHLELEITESVLLSFDRSTRVLQRLKDCGVMIAIDDFGTGYSSLSQLKNLPVDTLKIDRIFVHGLPAALDNRAIATAIIALAHSLGLHVIAEGVESADQLQFLRAQGCDEVQGYLLYPALPADAMTTLLRQTRH